jgi:hypothetical protein
MNSSRDNIFEELIKVELTNRDLEYMIVLNDSLLKLDLKREPPYTIYLGFTIFHVLNNLSLFNPRLYEIIQIVKTITQEKYKIVFLLIQKRRVYTDKFTDIIIKTQ